nr:hypothetical protein [Tanacetum cinerariifolium]
MGRDTIQLEDDVSTISIEYLLEFTSEYGIPESLHPELLAQRNPSWSFRRAKSVFTPSFLNLQTIAQPKAGGVPEDPDAMAVSSISITRLAVTVSSSTSWAAQSRVPTFTLVGFEALIKLNKSISAFTQE